MKGSRVQAVVQELRGEKIDIVPFDRDPARYVIAAIQPAEVHKVIVDEADGRMELVVPDEKLSLAIGRKGQNVRLAAQLTSWKLDIISETKFKQMEEEAIAALQQIDSVTEAIAKSMYRLGFRALEEVSEASIEELAAIPGLGGAETAEQHQGPGRHDHGAPAPGPHPHGGLARPSPSPIASGCCSSAASASARSSCSRRPATRRSRTAPRGRGSPRHPHRPRHQEGSRHQAGRARLHGQRAEGARRGARRRAPGGRRGSSRGGERRRRSRRSDRGWRSRRRGRREQRTHEVRVVDQQQPSTEMRNPEGTSDRASSRARIRTCVGCGEREDAATGHDVLVRLVLGPAGAVARRRGRGALGRGAHVHPRPGCIAGARGPRAAARRQESGPPAPAPTGRAPLPSTWKSWQVRWWPPSIVGSRACSSRPAARASSRSATRRHVDGRGVPGRRRLRRGRRRAILGEVRRAVAEGRAVAWGTKVSLSRVREPEGRSAGNRSGRGESRPGRTGAPGRRARARCVRGHALRIAGAAVVAGSGGGGESPPPARAALEVSLERRSRRRPRRVRSLAERGA